MSKDMAFDDFLIGLKLFGLHPKFTSTLDVIKSIFSVGLLTFVVISLTVSFGNIGNYNDFAKSVESAASVWQVYATHNCNVAI